MISNILKTLSDGELMVIADQMVNENLDEQMVYRQIVSKSNDGTSLDDVFDEMNSDTFRGTLPRLVAFELSNRYRSLLSK